LNPTPESQHLKNTLVEEGYFTPLVPGLTGNAIHVLGATYQAKTIAPDQESIDTMNLLQESEKWARIGRFTPENVSSLRVGYRMSTPDKLPLIGPVVNPEFLREHYLKALRGARNEILPDLMPESGEWLLTGLGSRGITYSSYGAEILASMMFGEPLPLEMDLLEHLHPARFFVRNLRKPGLE
jgi:tRNA 5-methylaminomethyl-2-thiouridine biosynthesis bifunctional protein